MCEGPGVSACVPSRYSEATWGKVAHAGKKGSETLNHGAARDDAWDLPYCRKLLQQLQPDDLRQRLEQSPWMLHGGMAPDSINWLKEAAAACSIPLKRNKNRKTKSEVVDEVLQIVAHTLHQL